MKELITHINKPMHKTPEMTAIVAESVETRTCGDGEALSIPSTMMDSFVAVGRSCVLAEDAEEEIIQVDSEEEIIQVDSGESDEEDPLRHVESSLDNEDDTSNNSKKRKVAPPKKPANSFIRSQYRIEYVIARALLKTVCTQSGNTQYMKTFNAVKATDHIVSVCTKVNQVSKKGAAAYRQAVIGDSS
jgi:hypothetical protein